MICLHLRNGNIQKLSYCTQSVKKLKSYSSTIFLPKTNFPLRLENQKLVERDEKISFMDEFTKLYEWQGSHLSEPEFVLHDGPPYANGNLHMGHAINKVLKDTILRSHIIKGHKVHFIPGWDCHGLPIELKALTKNSDQEPLQIREKARSFVATAIEGQKEGFKSWGILGDWNKYYTTSHPSYVKTQLKLFYKLYKKGLIYRDFKPVYWSPSTNTALAEAELEYNEQHKSPSLFTKFKIKQIAGKDCDKTFALVWTTTPWTLPSNQAVCYNPSIEYCLVKSHKDGAMYILAKDLAENVFKAVNCSFEVTGNLNSELMSQIQYSHPVYTEKVMRFIPGKYATAAKGTGLVHVAPAHGPEDFLLALNSKMAISSLVDENGCFNVEAGNDLKGKFVLSEGTQKVLEMIKEDIFFLSEIVHSYPYDWRSKKPVIIRASQQWFVNTEAVKSRAIEVLDDVEIFPKLNSEIYKRTLTSQIQKRPYWCISRQRKWGVPIPVFFNKSNGSVVINEDLIRHFCDLIDRCGTDCWWKLPLEELLPLDLRNGLEIFDIEKGQDILDIWFDSGISWANILEGAKVADMYLEGVDQFTGWFQSSLITSVALRDKAPFKSIYVHGFAVDENGAKMSKSLGNVIDPKDILKGTKKQKAFGIDALRWWVVCHANQDSVANVSNNILQTSADEIQKVRSVIRFAIASLGDYTFTPSNYDDLSLIDKYMLHLLHKFYTQHQEDLKYYQFNKISRSLQNLLTNSVSALYYTTIKDRLYCDTLDSPERRSSQFVLWQIFEIVSQVIAPIIPHMAEEMYLYFPKKSGKSYFTSVHLQPEEHWLNVKIEQAMTHILETKRQINKQVEGSSLNFDADVSFPKEVLEILQEANKKDAIEHELQEIFQLSEVKINRNAASQCEFKLEKTTKFSCARCRKMNSVCENELCFRCNSILKSCEDKVVIMN